MKQVAHIPVAEAKIYILDFWILLHENNVAGIRMIELLREMLLFRVYHSGIGCDERTRRRRERRRTKCFDTASGKRCAACGDSAEERHHIIPIHYGGWTSSENIIHLCSDCHREVHK